MTKKPNPIEEMIASLTDTSRSLEEQKSYADSGEQLVEHVEMLLLLFLGTNGCDCGDTDEGHKKKRELATNLYLIEATRTMVSVATGKPSIEDQQYVIAMVTALTFVHLFTRDEAILSALKADINVVSMIVDAAEQMTMSSAAGTMKIGKIRISAVDTNQIVAGVKQKIALTRHTNRGATH